MRSYLLNQMDEKKTRKEQEREGSAEQTRMWKDENENFFRNERLQKERVIFIN